MIKTVYNTASPEETTALGARLSSEGMIAAGDIVALSGDLGAGKTVLAKGIAKGFGVAETVLSPSYPVLLEYKTADRRNLYHFDMYRIASADDFFSLDFYEFVNENSLVLIEWFENIQNYIEKDLAVLTAALRKTGDQTREITITTLS